MALAVATLASISMDTIQEGGAVMWIKTDDGRWVDLPTKLGTRVRLADGREGTVVFNGLCGVGIKWGLHDPPAEDFEGAHGDVASIGVRVDFQPSPDWPWEPDALLREPWDGCERSGFNAEQCVGTDFEVIA